MENTDKLVKIYDRGYKLLGSGYLLGMSISTIKIKGKNLPILDSNAEIIVEIYGELSGIMPYVCRVSLASRNQLNATILKSEQMVERRSSLKMRTDLYFHVDHIVRNGEDISKNVPSLKINVLNLSIGGMLISSNYELMKDDILSFCFQCSKDQIVPLKATVIRIDKIYDTHTKELSSINYGCKFEKMPHYDEAIIARYLYDRQLQLYKNR